MREVRKRKACATGHTFDLNRPARSAFPLESEVRKIHLPGDDHGAIQRVDHGSYQGLQSLVSQQSGDPRDLAADRRRAASAVILTAVRQPPI